MGYRTFQEQMKLQPHEVTLAQFQRQLEDATVNMEASLKRLRTSMATAGENTEVSPEYLSPFLLAARDLESQGQRALDWNRDNLQILRRVQQSLWN